MSTEYNLQAFWLDLDGANITVGMDAPDINSVQRLLGRFGLYNKSRDLQEPIQKLQAKIRRHIESDRNYLLLNEFPVRLDSQAQYGNSFRSIMFNYTPANDDPYKIFLNIRGENETRNNGKLRRISVGDVPKIVETRGLRYAPIPPYVFKIDEISEKVSDRDKIKILAVIKDSPATIEWISNQTGYTPDLVDVAIRQLAEKNAVRHVVRRVGDKEHVSFVATTA